MEVWTEIVSEDAGITHVSVGEQRDCVLERSRHVGDNMVLWSIGSPDEHVLRAIKDRVDKRRAFREASERFIKRSRDRRAQMDKRKEAVHKLRAAGYDDEDIPL